MKYSKLINVVLGVGLLTFSTLFVHQSTENKSINAEKQKIEVKLSDSFKEIDGLNKEILVQKSLYSEIEKINLKYKKDNKKLKEEIVNKNNEIIKVKNENKKLYKKKSKNRVSNGQIFNVSFYSANFASTGKSKGHKNYGRTASGKMVSVGRTLACPPQYKFGTKIKIDGIGVRVCEDRGGAIKGNRLDVYVSTEREAYRLGRKYLRATVVR